MLINIDNGKLELIKDLELKVDALIAKDDDNAIAAYEQLRNLCTTELLAQIKLIDAGFGRSEGNEI